MIESDNPVQFDQGLKPLLFATLWSVNFNP